MTLAELDRLHAAWETHDPEGNRHPVDQYYDLADAVVDAYPALAACLRAIPSPVFLQGWGGDRTEIFMCAACHAVWYAGGANETEYHNHDCWWPALARLRGEG